MATVITDQNIKELIASGQPVVVDLWAEWCGPCRQMSPIVDELSQQYEGKAVIGKYNVDEDTELSEEYGIRSIPTLLFFKNGELKEKQVGAIAKPALIAKIDALIAE